MKSIDNGNCYIFFLTGLSNHINYTLVFDISKRSFKARYISDETRGERASERTALRIYLERKRYEEIKKKK